MKKFYLDLIASKIIPEQEYNLRIRNGFTSGMVYFGEYRTRGEAIADYLSTR